MPCDRTCFGCWGSSSGLDLSHFFDRILRVFPFRPLTLGCAQPRALDAEREREESGPLKAGGVLVPCDRACFRGWGSNFISKKVFVHWSPKVNSPTKSSTYYLLFLIEMLS